jgi:DNA-binding CsgD family transcriptional regulator
MQATLGAAFRFTKAESRVMTGLLEGLQISEIAQRFGVSINTVRTQIQRLFDKTGTKRQSDLVRIVSSSLPPIRTDGTGLYRSDDR